MSFSYRDTLDMLLAFTLKVRLPHVPPKLGAIINPIVITKHCWQDDTACSETTYISMVTKHHLSLMYSTVLAKGQ